MEEFECPSCKKAKLVDESYYLKCPACNKKYVLDYAVYNDDGDEYPYLTEEIEEL